eukprot:6485530-Amphidinium_carterae.1
MMHCFSRLRFSKSSGNRSMSPPSGVRDDVLLLMLLRPTMLAWCASRSGSRHVLGTVAEKATLLASAPHWCGRAHARRHVRGIGCETSCSDANKSTLLSAAAAVCVYERVLTCPNASNQEAS